MQEYVGITDETKKELVSGLYSIFKDNLEYVILYGSVARGEATSESDVDIAIVVSSGIKPSELEAFLHWNAEFDLNHGRVFSVIDIESDTFKKWGDVVPFYRNIRDEGVILWKAA